MRRIAQIIIGLPLAIFAGLCFGIAAWWGVMRRRDEFDEANEPITHDMTAVAPEDEDEDEIRRWLADMMLTGRLDRANTWFWTQSARAPTPLEPFEVWAARRRAQRATAN